MDDDSAPSREKHGSLYFAAGNIVLLALRPDKPGLLFRVHKSVLSSHSPIFMDMFDVCNPPDGPSDAAADHDNFYDGVPLVHMPDNGEHLESVLKIMYYQSSLPWTPRSPHYPALIAPILDLARKYEIDRMEEQILENLESDWPQTLQDWDKLEREIELMKANGSEGMDDRLPEPASAIQLARQFEIFSILPAAFYHLSRLSILDDWDKIRADSSMTVRNPTKRTTRWGLLSATDFRCLFHGKEEMIEYMRRCPVNGRPHHDKRDAPCVYSEVLWKDICDMCSQSSDPLALLRNPPIPDVVQCSICTRRLKAQIPHVRVKLWQKLGVLFHLDEA